MCNESLSFAVFVVCFKLPKNVRKAGKTCIRRSTVEWVGGQHVGGGYLSKTKTIMLRTLSFIPQSQKCIDGMIRNAQNELSEREKEYTQRKEKHFVRYWDQCALFFSFLTLKKFPAVKPKKKLSRYRTRFPSISIRSVSSSQKSYF